MGWRRLFDINNDDDDDDDDGNSAAAEKWDPPAGRGLVRTWGPRRGHSNGSLQSLLSSSPSSSSLLLLSSASSSLSLSLLLLTASISSSAWSRAASSLSLPDHLNGGFFLKTVDWFNVYHSRMSFVCSVPWLSITKCCISRSKTLWHPLHYLLGASIEACRRPFDRNCFSLIKKSGGVLYWLTLTSNTCYT